MIVKGISFRIWEKVIRFGTGFFFITIVISCFLSLLLYVFEDDFEYLFVKSTPTFSQTTPKSAEMEVPADTVSLLDDKHTPYIPIPDIEKNIAFIHYNYRPDISTSDARQISLSAQGVSLLAQEQNKIYLNCNRPDSISFSNIPTPYSITPISIQDDNLSLKLEIDYRTKDNVSIFESSEIIELKKHPTKSTPLSKTASAAKKSLESASYLSSDKLISILGGDSYKNKKNQSRIYFKDNGDEPLIYVNDGDLLLFKKNKWTKAKAATSKKPLFKVNLLGNNQLTGTFWNENGFYKDGITINRPKTPSSLVQNFSFDKLYKRNNQSLICKIKNKTFILKPGDWLVKKELCWRPLTSTKELEDLLSYKTSAEILIFDKLLRRKEKDIFIGYIFDQTRSESKKLEIVLKKKDSLSYNS